MDAATAMSLELDDIQAGALYERPSPYVGVYLLLRIRDRADGRELVRRLHRIANPAGSADTPDNTSITVAFTYHGLKALGVPQASLDSFAPEFREGMAARAEILGDVGESGPDHWEQPLGSSDVHVAIAVLSSDADQLRAVAEKARQAHAELPGIELIWRQDCYQLATGRTSFGFKDGIGQPAVEGSGRPPTNPRERPLKAGEIILGYPDETGELPPMPTPDVLGRNGTYVVFRKLHTKVAAYRSYLRARAANRAEEDLLGAKMVGRWQSGAPLALSPDTDDPELGSDPRRNNDFALRRRPPRLQVPGRRPRAQGQPPRRAGPGRQRGRPPAPDDPARHQLRADAARRRDRGRRGRPRDHLRLRRRPPQAAVRVRQDPVAQRRHLHRRPARVRPARRTARRSRAASPSRSGRSAAGCRTCRRSSSPAAGSTASPRASARCAGSPSWTPDQPPPREEAR